MYDSNRRREEPVGVSRRLLFADGTGVRFAPSWDREREADITVKPLSIRAYLQLLLNQGDGSSRVMRNISDLRESEYVLPHTCSFDVGFYAEHVLRDASAEVRNVLYVISFDDGSLQYHLPACTSDFGGRFSSEDGFRSARVTSFRSVSGRRNPISHALGFGFAEPLDGVADLDGYREALGSDIEVNQNRAVLGAMNKIPCHPVSGLWMSLPVLADERMIADNHGMRTFYQTDIMRKWLQMLSALAVSLGGGIGVALNYADGVQHPVLLSGSWTVCVLAGMCAILLGVRVLSSWRAVSRDVREALNYTDAKEFSYGNIVAH